MHSRPGNFCVSESQFATFRGHCSCIFGRDVVTDFVALVEFDRK